MKSVGQGLAPAVLPSRTMIAFICDDIIGLRFGNSHSFFSDISDSGKFHLCLGGSKPPPYNMGYNFADLN